MKETRLIAAQIESLGINGLGLARGKNAIGFRAIPLLPLPEAGRFDGKPVICTLKEMGPYDPAGHYHQVSFLVPIVQKAIHRFLRLELIQGNSIVVPDFAPGEAATVHLEWAFDGTVAVARVTSDQPVDLMLLMNGCLRPATAVALSVTTATLEQDRWRVHAALAGDACGYAQAGDLERLEALVRQLTQAPGAETPSMTGHRFRLTPSTPVYVALGESPTVADPQRIDEQLEVGRRSMGDRLMRSTGVAEHCADAIQRLVGFASNYDSVSGLRYLPVNRDWAGPNSGGIEAMWDNFFDAYLGCLHDPELGKEALRQILYLIETRGMDGPRLPCQRNLIVPIVYSKMVRFMGDRDFAAATLPTMMTFVRFFFGDRGDGHPWRDGNDDGLIELGSCLKPGEAPIGRIIQNAFDETGYDDSPMYSAGFSYEWRGLLAEGVTFDFDRRTLNLTMVGQNSLYVAACRSVAVVAEWVGATQDAAWLRAEADRVAARLRERLLDPAVGYYRNRFFDGTFSPVKAPDMFFPLMAGLCDDGTQRRLREILLDPRQFWGDNVVPTVSRDDAGYGDEPVRDAYWNGNYWRGNVWPPTNYMVYLAVRNAGWCDVAAELSAKSVRLFMNDWLPRHHANENYPPEGGTDRSYMFTGNGGRDPHYVWAGLLPLIGLEELFSIEDTEDGIRFGSLQSSSWGTWEGFIYQGHRGSIRCDGQGLCLSVPGLLSVEADKPVAVRAFVIDGAGVRFRYSAETAVNVRVACGDGKATFALPPAIDGVVRTSNSHYGRRPPEGGTPNA